MHSELVGRAWVAKNWGRRGWRDQAPRPPTDTPLGQARGRWGGRSLQLLVEPSPGVHWALAVGPVGRVRAAGWLTLISSWPPGSRQPQEQREDCASFWACSLPAAALPGPRGRASGRRLARAQGAQAPRSLPQAKQPAIPSSGHCPCRDISHDVSVGLSMPSPGQILPVTRPWLMAVQPQPLCA